jgi:hypothetical protein
MQDIGYMFAVHTQQLMSKETYVKASGTWGEILQKEYGQGNILVSPFDLIVDYDIIVKDGSTAIGDSESWTEIFRILVSQPTLFQSFDMVRIFKHIARIMGAKDVESFTLGSGPIPPVSTKIDSQVNIDKGVQSGNVVPIEQFPTGGRR